MLTNVIGSVSLIKVFPCFEIIYTLQLVEPSTTLPRNHLSFLIPMVNNGKVFLCKAAAHVPESVQYYVHHQLQMPALFTFHATGRVCRRSTGKLPLMRCAHCHNGQSRSTPITATGSNTTTGARIPTGSSPIHKHPRRRQPSRWQAVH